MHRPNWYSSRVMVSEWLTMQFIINTYSSKVSVFCNELPSLASMFQAVNVKILQEISFSQVFNYGDCAFPYFWFSTPGMLVIWVVGISWNSSTNCGNFGKLVSCVLKQFQLRQSKHFVLFWPHRNIPESCEPCVPAGSQWGGTFFLILWFRFRWRKTTTFSVIGLAASTLH